MALVAVVTLGAAGHGAGARAARYHAVRYLMGTWCDLVIFDEPRARAEAAAEAALAEIARLEGVMSRYREASELSRLNEAAGRGAQPVSPDLAAVVGAALDACRASGGAFDPTVAPLLRAWGFYTDAPGLPTGGALRAARRHVGCERVRLDMARHTIALPAGSAIDLGGIGKGFAVDRALEVLRRHNVGRVKIDFGSSSLAFAGAQPGGWPVAVRDPCANDRAIATFTLDEGSVSSSGQYERFFTRRSRTYGHIVDPRTGAPVRSSLLAVTVVARTATEADALSTAAFVLGPVDGTRLVARTPGGAAIFISRTPRPLSSRVRSSHASSAGEARGAIREATSQPAVTITAVGSIRNLRRMDD